MLYVFNNKSLKSKEEVSLEIELYVKDNLKRRGLFLRERFKTLRDSYDNFTTHFLKPPKSPNPIKHPSEASNLIIYLNDKHFRSFLPKANCFNKTEKLCVVCYDSKDVNKITIEVKLMLIRLCLEDECVSITLIEI